jgi:2-haloacid dehalogenase
MVPFEEAGEALRLLNEAGISTGALSNSSKKSVESLAENSRLPLSPVLGTDAVRAFKPHPDVYAAAVSAVEARPQEVALVTAHSWDAMGAKRAGLCAAWVSRNEGLPVQLDERFDFAANDLAEAAQLILTHEPRSGAQPSLG